jgi:hypothetical protein
MRVTVIGPSAVPRPYLQHGRLGSSGWSGTHLARLNFYHALRDRSLKLRKFARLARTFLPLAVAQAISGNTVKTARAASQR